MFLKAFWKTLISVIHSHVLSWWKKVKLIRSLKVFSFFGLWTFFLFIDLYLVKLNLNVHVHMGLRTFVPEYEGCFEQDLLLSQCTELCTNYLK